MHELPLIIQSILLESAVGIMIFLVIAKLRDKKFDGKIASICAAAAAVLGVLTSITHMGQPLRAFNAMFNMGSSWLSRETLAVGAFAGCCVLSAAIYIWKPAMQSALRLLEWAAAAIGIILLFIMGNLYVFTSVPAWKGANTFIEFYASTVMLGAMIFFAITVKQQNKMNHKILGAVSMAALAFLLIGSEIHAAALGTGSGAALQSAAIISANMPMIAVKWILIIGGIGIFCFGGAAKKGSKKSEPNTLDRNTAMISACAVFVGMFIGKVVFFESMITTGIGKM